jgi:serine/threonine protein kinase
LNAIRRRLAEIRYATRHKENLDASPEAQKQFGREAGILARLSHPNLPRVTDHVFIPGLDSFRSK